MAETPYEGLNDDLLRRSRDLSDSMADIASAATRLGKELEDVDGYTSGINNNFTQIRNSANRVADIQKKARDSAKGTSEALGEQTKNLNRVKELNIAIDKLYAASKSATGETRDNLIAHARHLTEARDNSTTLAEMYGKMAADGAKLDKASSAFDTMGQVAQKYFGSNFAKPFQAASDAARQQTLDNAQMVVEREKLDEVIKKGGKGLTRAKLEELNLTKVTGELAGTAANEKLKKYRASLKVQSSMKAGFKAMGPMISKALGPLLWIKLAVDAIKFFVSLFVDANKQSVELARSMGTSVSSADVLRDRFREIRTITGTTRNNIESLVKAQAELNDEFGAAFVASNGTLDSQTFLTSRLGINAAQAAKLNVRFEATSTNARSSTDSIIEMSQAFADTNGYAMPLDKLLKSTSEASGQIAASFGFSNEKIARAIVQVRKFGLNLTQAQSIAKGLLDFETSIGNELEAELLTGKQFNFERARALAATGRIGDATEEVMKQMQNLTEEQRRSPIIMESVAAATGLSVDALQDAFLIQQNNNRAAQKYEEILKSGNEAEIARWRAQSGLEQATRDEIEARVTLGEQFQEAMADVKQQFVGLVKGGTIQILVDAIKDFADFVAKFTGPSTAELAQKEAARIAADNNIDIAVKEKVQEYASKASAMEAASKIRMGNAGSTLGFKLLSKFYGNKALQTANQDLNVQDFTIKTHPKDTLVMAGGTKLGQDSQKTNQLLERLISAVERGGDVYIDGNKAGRALVLASHKLS